MASDGFHHLPALCCRYVARADGQTNVPRPDSGGPGWAGPVLLRLCPVRSGAPSSVRQSVLRAGRFSHRGGADVLGGGCPLLRRLGRGRRLRLPGKEGQERERQTGAEQEFLVRGASERPPLCLAQQPICAVSGGPADTSREDRSVGEL